MIYSLFPTKDATLYEFSSSMNSGIDEILEITKIVSSSKTPDTFNSRIVIDFDTSNVSSSVGTGEISGSDGQQPKIFLKLFNVTQEQVPAEYKLAVSPLSESWAMGLGKTTYSPSTKEGCSWDYKTGATAADSWATPGGTIYLESGSTYTSIQTFNNSSGDINIDVTAIITGSWIGAGTHIQSINTLKNGIVITRSGSQETDGTRYGSLKYFSKETHTIYPPRLDIKWDDSSFVTGSLTALSSDDIGVFATNLKPYYRETERAKIRLNSRELYPTKTYTTTSVSSTSKYLPSSSYYSIVDASTGETIIPFDTSYTKVSVDGTGNYFNLWMDSLLPERLYKIDIRVDHRQYTNQKEFYDCNTLFEVVR